MNILSSLFAQGVINLEDYADQPVSDTMPEGIDPAVLEALENGTFDPSMLQEGATSIPPDMMAAIMAIVAIVIFVSLIIGAIAYVYFSFFLMRIFAKAGVKPWIAWVPIYNTWKLLEIGGKPGIWAALGIIPPLMIITVVMMFISMYHIGKKLGKSGNFLWLGIFLPVVWYPWLALDKSVWNEAASPNAPSRHRPEPQPGSYTNTPPTPPAGPPAGTPPTGTPPVPPSSTPPANTPPSSTL